MEEMTNRTRENIEIDMIAFLKEEIVAEHWRDSERCLRESFVADASDAGK
jgi:hypothetical protein